MGLDSLFSDRKTLTIVSMIVIAVGLLGEFIVAIFWWSKLYPWFSHALSDGKTVYQCLTACWVLSLLGLIAIVIFIIFTFFVPSICDNITGNTMILAICIAVVGALSIGSLVSGAYGSSFAVKSPKICDDVGEDEYTRCYEELYINKCYKYIQSAVYGIELWLGNGHMDKEDDYNKWLDKKWGEDDVYKKKMS